MIAIFRGKRRAVRRFAFTLTVALLGSSAITFISPATVSALENQQNEQVTPQSASQQPASARQPGPGAQLHTGSSSGFTADARVQNLLADHQFLRIQTELNQLPPEQAQ